MYLTSYLLLIDTLNSHNNLACNDEHVPLEHVHGLRRGATHVCAHGQCVCAAYRDAEGSSGEGGSHWGLVCHVVAAQRFVTTSEIFFREPVANLLGKWREGSNGNYPKTGKDHNLNRNKQTMISALVQRYSGLSTIPSHLYHSRPFLSQTTFEMK